MKNRIVLILCKPPGIRVKHEDTHTLRLVSKLPDLRVEYVNWICYAYGLQNPLQEGVAPPEREKTLLKRGELPPRYSPVAKILTLSVW
ncbi:MAG: hypothetical protein IJD79_03215 [Clostridia bacterium]|nr:hypothetical protein [Clostridia bacterium]